MRRLNLGQSETLTINTLLDPIVHAASKRKYFLWQSGVIKVKEQVACQDYQSTGTYAIGGAEARAGHLSIPFGSQSGSSELVLIMLDEEQK